MDDSQKKQFWFYMTEVNLGLSSLFAKTVKG